MPGHILPISAVYASSCHNTTPNRQHKTTGSLLFIPHLSCELWCGACGFTSMGKKWDNPNTFPNVSCGCGAAGSTSTTHKKTCEPPKAVRSQQKTTRGETK